MTLSYGSDSLEEWIKKFHQVSFKGALELNDENCSDRLIASFAKYAKWDDDPGDFFLTPDNLQWMGDNWQYQRYAKVRIEAGVFESEETFLRWKINEPECYKKYDNSIIFDRIVSAIKRLQELGVDTGQLEETEKQLRTQRIEFLEKAIKSEQKDWRREEMSKEIEEIRAGLEKN